MKKYWIRQPAHNITTTIECEQVFWSGVACVFVKGGATIAVIALQPGDIIVEDGAWKDVTAEEWEARKKFADLSEGAGN